ncbi:hypothetical protein UR09_06015 [Candidatus Nitromaritima sp. SCGC AAA799-A02]|nr:hypothetical protein UR09_06015 [Candidatus Nitromaritima sp. SCGC AAA799-A02]
MDKIIASVLIIFLNGCINTSQYRDMQRVTETEKDTLACEDILFDISITQDYIDSVNSDFDFDQMPIIDQLLFVITVPLQETLSRPKANETIRHAQTRLIDLKRLKDEKECSS